MLTFDKIVNFCKSKGFFHLSSEIYGGLNGLYDKGHLGTLLSERIKNYWAWHMRQAQYDMIKFDGTLISNQKVWEASGHVKGFHDPLVDCKECKSRYRTDDIDLNKSCMHCGKKNWSDSRQFNMMFSTNLGAMEDSSSKVYLRPETAQSIFSQFKNIVSTNRVKIPFGVMQIGHAFRNEITPKQFIFRTREFNQMEMEFLCKEEDSNFYFDWWKKYRLDFYQKLLFNNNKIRFRNHLKEELSHYSSGTVDIGYEFPFGWKELEGIANRSNFDLTQHKNMSSKDLSLFDDKNKENYIPSVVECSVGLERLLFSIICNSYLEEKVNDELRIVLKLPSFLSPYICAIFPLTKNEEDFSFNLYEEINKKYDCFYDSSGSIGKRYRRQDEIGTPICITIDEETKNDDSVTLRFRDKMNQIRVKVKNILDMLEKETSY